MKEMNWKIIDWAGNTCFGGKTFKTFEDGWDFIFLNFKDYENPEEEYQEYFVIKT